MTGLELAGTLIGATIFALGSVLVLASTLRLRQGAMTLLTFGLTGALYGARLLVEQAPIRATLGITPGQATGFVAVATYAINVPLMLFVQAVIGRGWRDSIRWTVHAAIAFAVAATAADLALQQPAASDPVHNRFVLILFAIVVGNVLYASRILRTRTLLTEPIVLVGGAIFILSVVDRNLDELIWGENLEPIGMLAFVACLGYAAGRAVFRGEAEFASVQRELETARRIQSSLLPRQISTLSGLDVAVRYVPAAAVAGDIYDVIRIGPSRLGVLVADVSGHGIPAALVASMVKLAFSAQAEYAHDPARVLTSMNQMLCRHLEHSYVTAVYAVVDMDRSVVTIANAGHPPALLHRRSARTVELQREHGLMLGVFLDAQYGNIEVERFAAGDRLLLYSDGVSEARDRAGQFFDGERVKQWLSRIERTTAEQFAESALGELTRWTGGSRFDDDVTFAIVEARAER